MSEWYYAHGGEQKGPVPVSELQRLAESGEFDPSNDLVWHEGMDDWKPAGTIDELKQAFSPAAAASDTPPAAPADVTPAAPAPQASAPYTAPTAAPATTPGMPRTSGQAIASIICGLIGFFTCFVWCLALPLGVVGIIMGHIARAKIAKDPENLKGKGLALTGLISGYLSVLAAVIFLAIGIWIQTLSPDQLQNLEWLPPEVREEIQKQQQLREQIQRESE